MKFDKIANAAKKALDSRGGTEGLKRDVEKLRDIAMSEGTPKERAKRAADHLKRPQRPGGETGAERQGHGDAATERPQAGPADAGERGGTPGGAAPGKDTPGEGTPRKGTPGEGASGGGAE